MEGTLMSISGAPEQDWAAATDLVMPVLLPVGTPGIAADTYDPSTLHLTRGTAGGTPIHWPGPAGIPVAVAIPAMGFHVLVNADHVAAWGVMPAAVISTAMANLTAWSNSTPWDEEASGVRRILVSDSGEGWDAARLLLPEIRLFLERELANGGRVLVAVPSRHLLVAGCAPSADAGFAGDLRAFVRAQHADADEPVDPRVFVLEEGGLTEAPGTD
jgi:hypothetical protein